MPLPNFGPAPPPPSLDPRQSFTNPLWQRWFSNLGSGLPALMKQVFTTAGGTINGNVTINGNLTANAVGQTSDERLKFRWRRLRPDFVECLAELKEVNRAGTFSWRAGGPRAAGTSAQHVRRFLAQAVHKGADELLRVDYGVLGALGAIECADRLLRAEARVKQLELSLQEMQDRLWRIEMHGGLR